MPRIIENDDGTLTIGNHTYEPWEVPDESDFEEGEEE